MKDYDTEIALRLRQDVDFAHEGGSRKETVDEDGNIQVENRFLFLVFSPLNSELSREATVTPMPMESWSRLNTLLEKTDSAS